MATMKMSRRPLLSSLAALAGAAGTAQAWAQAASFPTGRVTLVVPFPPGASTDVTMRA
jgi:tripartite-type tricarboxylate transporter receptor subunit TctC